MTNRLIKKEKIHMSRIHELFVLLPLVIFWDRNDMENGLRTDCVALLFCPSKNQFYSYLWVVNRSSSTRSNVSAYFSHQKEKRIWQSNLLLLAFKKCLILTFCFAQVSSSGQLPRKLRSPTKSDQHGNSWLIAVSSSVQDQAHCYS